MYTIYDNTLLYIFNFDFGDFFLISLFTWEIYDEMVSTEQML